MATRVNFERNLIKRKIMKNDNKDYCNGGPAHQEP